MIPGSNILAQALSVIGQTSFSYYKFLERVTDEYGIDVPLYAEPVTITGSLQPVPRNLYQNLGLDLNKNYITVYSTSPLFDVRRDTSGDNIVWAGLVFQALSANDWKAVDGWQSVLFIQVDELPSTTSPLPQ